MLNLAKVRKSVPLVSNKTITMGWSRAGLVILDGGFPAHYVHLALPIYMVTFFAWELYEQPRRRAIFQHILLIVVLLFLPFNILSGFQGWGNWYSLRMSSFEKDMAVGMSYKDRAERHQDFLIHWWESEQVVSNMKMLQNAQIGPFADRKK